jgi:hypothetical protein
LLVLVSSTSSSQRSMVTPAPKSHDSVFRISSCRWIAPLYFSNARMDRIPKTDPNEVTGCSRIMLGRLETERPNDVVEDLERYIVLPWVIGGEKSLHFVCTCRCCNVVGWNGALRKHVNCLFRKEWHHERHGAFSKRLCHHRASQLVTSSLQNSLGSKFLIFLLWSTFSWV